MSASRRQSLRFYAIASIIHLPVNQVSRSRRGERTIRKQQTGRLILARETICDLSRLDQVRGATRGTITCTLISVGPGCSDYSPGPITTLMHTCPM